MPSILRKIITHPVFPLDEERTRTSAILNSILKNISVMLVMAAFASAFFFARPEASLAIVGGVAMMVVLSKWIMHTGHVRTASVVLLVGLWLLTTALIFFAGGMRSVDAVYYIAITVLAGILLGSRGSVLSAILSAAAGAAMVLMEIRGVALPVHFPVPPWAGWINLCLALHLAGSSLILAQRLISDSLSEAHEELAARIATEVALRKSEERANAFLDAIPDIMFTLDQNGTVLGYQADPADLYTDPGVRIVGERLETLLPTAIAEQTFGIITRALETEEIQTFEYELDIPQKGTRNFESRMVKCGDGEVLALMRDITERKRREEEVRESLREKEVLLREIHHRVKNNLQVILSLISLQSMQSDSERQRGVFDDIKNRIRAMSLAHETLYKSDNLAHINLGSYLSSLTEHLKNTYFPVGGPVEILYEVQDVFIDIDRAIPVGLIVNELLTNAIKYAFKDGRSGTIRIECARQDELFRLAVSDNGIGLPAGVDPLKTETLGLRIVNALATQLRGRISVSGNGGTSIEIVFS